MSIPQCQLAPHCSAACCTCRPGSGQTRFVPDIFQSDATFRRLPAIDADLLYLTSRLGVGAPHGEVLQELIADTPWRVESVVLWGRRYPQPRLTAWYGDENARYVYSGIELDPLPWTPRLLAIRASVERATDSRFNSVLLNYYRNERDSMGMHSDDEAELLMRGATQRNWKHGIAKERRPRGARVNLTFRYIAERSASR